MDADLMTDELQSRPVTLMLGTHLRPKGLPSIEQPAEKTGFVGGKEDRLAKLMPFLAWCEPRPNRIALRPCCANGVSPLAEKPTELTDSVDRLTVVLLKYGAGQYDFGRLGFHTITPYEDFACNSARLQRACLGLIANQDRPGSPVGQMGAVR